MSIQPFRTNPWKRRFPVQAAFTENYKRHPQHKALSEFQSLLTEQEFLEVCPLGHPVYSRKKFRHENTACRICAERCSLCAHSLQH